MSSSNKLPNYSTTDCRFITFSFRVMFNEKLFVSSFDKILLILSSPKYTESVIYEPFAKVVKLIFKIII